MAEKCKLSLSLSLSFVLIRVGGDRNGCDNEDTLFI
jgi:hypothetical protein